MRQPPDVESLFKPLHKSNIHTRFSLPLLRWTEKELGVRLPRALVDVLKRRNGGYLRTSGLVLPRPIPWHTIGRVYTFNMIAGIDRQHWQSLTKQLLAAKGWGVPPGLVPLDGDGHWWVCLDYRRCGSRGRPSITHYDVEMEKEVQIARSFEDLLRRLVEPAQEYIFACGDAESTETQLDRVIRRSGWRKVTTRHRVWTRGRGWHLNRLTRWKWKSGAAEIDMLRNGQWVSQLPAQTVLMVLSVGESQSRRCVLAVDGVLGSRALLVRQPVDRKPIDLLHARLGAA